MNNEFNVDILTFMKNSEIENAWMADRLVSNANGFLRKAYTEGA